MSYTATWGETSSGDGESLALSHQMICPTVMPDASKNNCSVEAAAYATALANLQQAQAIANVTYRAWYECEYGGDTNATEYVVDVPSAEYSVLVKD